MLESMNKKTLIIIGSSIIGLIVCLLIVVWLISIIKPHYYSYEDFEVKVTEATKNYYKITLLNYLRVMENIIWLIVL